MLSILILAMVVAAGRLVHVAVQSLRELPRDNEDMVFY